MPLKDYERRVDNKEMPSEVVIFHPSDGRFQDTTTIEWNGSEWIRLEYFVCDENLAPPGDFTRERNMEEEHYYILLAEYGLTLEDVDVEKLLRMSPSELAEIAEKKFSSELTTVCPNCHRRAIVKGIHEESRPVEGDEASAGIRTVILIKGIEHCPFCGHVGNSPSVIDRKYT